MNTDYTDYTDYTDKREFTIRLEGFNKPVKVILSEDAHYLESLVDEYDEELKVKTNRFNKLAEAATNLCDAYEEICEERDELVAEYDTLVDQYNNLLDHHLEIKRQAAYLNEICIEEV